MSAPTTLKKLFIQQYTLDTLRDEAHQLVEKGILSRQQPIFSLCSHIPAREWPYLESELERHDFLLRDRIVDLIGNESWSED
ncbi:MAG: DUF4327 family protein [Cyanobacteria bacterium Co-bin13]|nr:DUF4327 family protein [Cyanobacteria bacterium Co-bin13]